MYVIVVDVVVLFLYFSAALFIYFSFFLSHVRMHTMPVVACVLYQWAGVLLLTAAAAFLLLLLLVY